MKAKVKIKIPKESLILPGKPMSEIEFQSVIKKAEKGPFFPIEELEKHIQKWKEKYGK